MAHKTIGLIASNHRKAQEAYATLLKAYRFTPLTYEDAACPNVNAIVALGGDGFMLHTLHAFRGCNLPIYGMNCGTVGFLMNEFRVEDLLPRLEAARPTVIHPLRMTAIDAGGKKHQHLAYNEVSLLRMGLQAARIRISLDGTMHLKRMICDGVLIATPAGSSAYNASTGGPILPLSANLLALTPISPFRPRRWRGALLPQKITVQFEILTPKKRPVHAMADFKEVRNVVSVEVHEARTEHVTLLFDPGHSLEERIIREQFTP